MDSTGTEREPDRVNAAVEGYFRLPAVWIGEAPKDPTAERGMHMRALVASSMQFSCGINAYAMRNGLFLFDFLNSTVAPVVVIPSYERRVMKLPPKAVIDAALRLEASSTLRTQIMNVHQACLISAEFLVKRRSAAMGFPVTGWNLVHTLRIDMAVPYHDDTEDVHALARNVLDGKYVPAILLNQRRVLELEVVEHSFKALDHIISCAGGKYLPIVEAAYQSASRCVEHRLGESIAIGWTACEQLITEDWKILVERTDAARTEANRMTRDRRKKLIGRDYTASVMVEMLDMSGSMSSTLYGNLEIARKARNNWAHDMKVPTGNEVWACQTAIQEMLARRGIQLQLQLGFRGSGGASWPLETLKRVRPDAVNLRS